MKFNVGRLHKELQIAKEMFSFLKDSDLKMLLVYIEKAYWTGFNDSVIKLREEK